MSLSLTNEPPKYQKTHAELKLRRLRINRNIKYKQKISSSKNITGQNIQIESQIAHEIDTQQFNIPMQSSDTSQVEYDIVMYIERQTVLPQEIQCPDSIRHIQEHELPSVHQNAAVVEAITEPKDAFPFSNNCHISLRFLIRNMIS